MGKDAVSKAEVVRSQSHRALRDRAIMLMDTEEVIEVTRKIFASGKTEILIMTERKPCDAVRKGGDMSEPDG